MLIGQHRIDINGGEGVNVLSERSIIHGTNRQVNATVTCRVQCNKLSHSALGSIRKN